MTNVDKADLLTKWQGRYLHPAFWICTGLGSGLIRPAPGTWGSLAALMFALPIIGGDFAQEKLLVMIALSIVLGIYAANLWEKHTGSHDDGRIVIDEFAGMWIAMLPLTVTGLFTPLNLALSFGLFRFFDIIKPWPIGWLDKHISGGLGVMLDDVIAGLFALGALLLIIFIVIKVTYAG